ncbi:MAG: bifunctional demethylmenaquinone methyltransferase/2-methoxy-6-polyprenyl-1,4-benzoquinol methylase UbiE [Thermodesulfobacteriota bacterium]|nr:bifunctional demethylmenaquinone methyltransferase/2-methoxy-6-polyprenyl-1,4-benzoquinol methylase UbiE [Thermodesulfobacteriota bacterium]
MINIELNFIKEMFDTIAPKYDFLNRFLSMRQDVRWRREMVSAAEVAKNSRVLDVACGTCDVALEIRKQTRESTKIVGIDFSPGMLALGKKKISAKGKAYKIDLTAGNALALPFNDKIFNAVFIAFGIRNIMDRKGALSAFYNALEQGGKLAVLELTTPEQGFFKKLYMLYFKKILPLLGGLFSKNARAYEYLPASVIKFPDPPEFVQIMKQAGFNEIQWKRMTFGIVTLFVGTKTEN